jgi:hypothetical protein
MLTRAEIVLRAFLAPAKKLFTLRSGLRREE